MPANSFDTYEAIGNAEDVANAIWTIEQNETPFSSSVPRTKATSTLHEWQTDTLATANGDNAAVEGADATITAQTATSRLTNRTQILQKAFGVTGTQEVVNKYGRKSELAYLTAKAGAEIKRDIEAASLRNSAAVTGNASTARMLAAVPTWLTTNTSVGSGGADATTAGASARTDGTQRDFTEAMLKTVLQSIWTEGGRPDCLMVGAHNKQVVSGFAGNATRYVDGSEKQLVTSIDVYVSDFSTLTVKPNAHMRARDALVLQTDMWAIAELRPFQVIDIGRKGDSVEKQLLCELTIEARNESSSGGVFDLTTS